jgi:hypothetical protein
MGSKKMYYQHLYKEIFVDIEALDVESMNKKRVKEIVQKIYLLEKKGKREILLKKLKDNKNFIEQFSQYFKRSIVTLMEELERQEVIS